MIEGIIGTAAATLMAQGTGWVLAVAFAMVAYFLDKRNGDLQKKFDAYNAQAEEAVRRQYEKRIEEFREIFDVLTEHTNTMKSMHSSVVASTDAINQLARGFAELIREIENNKAMLGDQSSQLSIKLEDVRSRLEELQRTARI